MAIFPRSLLSIFIFAVAALRSHSFTPPLTGVAQIRQTRQNVLSTSPLNPVVSFHTETSLSMGRRWNFNDGYGPFGLKNNAEIWNGRVAQMAFVIIFLQELITGKGCIKGLQDGDLFSIVLLGMTGLTVTGLTIWLGIRGYDEDIGKTFDVRDLDDIFEGEL
mmetsp:Transcript_47308/g.47759  ORF Transcript_47308/g.47759 Transcript_47308/m.47759 type:complete len:162 (-) Transcript_47308:614-1099(-)